MEKNKNPPVNWKKVWTEHFFDFMGKNAHASVRDTLVIIVIALLMHKEDASE